MASTNEESDSKYLTFWNVVSVSVTDISHYDGLFAADKKRRSPRVAGGRERVVATSPQGSEEQR